MVTKLTFQGTSTMKSLEDISLMHNLCILSKGICIVYGLDLHLFIISWFFCPLICKNSLNLFIFNKCCNFADPWEFRRKRETMTAEEMEMYDLNKVVLLETLGNAGMDDSFPYIMSHINTTNAQWIKRAGCHALRKYHHDMVRLYIFFHSLVLCVYHSICLVLIAGPFQWCHTCRISGSIRG